MLARRLFREVQVNIHDLDERLLGYDREIAALARQSEPARRLMAMPGIGPITATAIVASVADMKVFRSGREFERRGYRKAMVALAAKHARMIWAILARGEPYRPAGAASPTG